MLTGRTRTGFYVSPDTGVPRDATDHGNRANRRARRRTFGRFERRDGDRTGALPVLARVFRRVLSRRVFRQAKASPRL